MKHLRFDMITAVVKCKEKRHPQTVMEELGIKYQHSTPQLMGDQWWFWNCENLPDNMPQFITDLNVDPMAYIGYGLNRQDAEKISGYTGEHK